jgi:outer membrane lipopolysaccharide assembly protein LptE/RlpB
MTRVLPLCLLLAGCGYHVASNSSIAPKNVKTIAVTSFGNGTPQPNLARQITSDVSRELISRTRYNVVADPGQAQALLTGTVVTFGNYPSIYDPATGRATGVLVVLTLNVSLTDQQTGKVLFSRNGFEFRQRYEIATDPHQYFEESSTAIERLSRDVARSLVSAILQGSF